MPPMPPSPRVEEGNVDVVPSETTGLLLAGSYDGVQDSPEVQLQSLGGKTASSSLSDDDKDDLSCQEKLRRRLGGDGGGSCGRIMSPQKHLVFMVVLGVFLLVGLCLLVVGVIPFFDNNKGGRGTGDWGGDDDSADHHHREDVFPTGDGRPLSLLDPVHDLGLPEVTRADDTSPDWSYLGEALRVNKIDNGRRGSSKKHIMDDIDTQSSRRALPTNAWYQNLLLARGKSPGNVQRVYPAPYLVDVVGLIPGLRVHSSHVNANAMVMQLSFNEDFGLVVGASVDRFEEAKVKQHKKITSTNDGEDDKAKSHKYKVVETTDIGISLAWDAMNMTSNIVRGMSFATMEYKKDFVGDDVLPTIAAPLAMKDPILIDGSDHQLKCSNTTSKKALVEKDIELYFHDSDFSWMVFLSQPVWIQCFVIPDVKSDVVGVEDKKGKTYIQVVEVDEKDCDGSADTLVVRAALIDQCTTNFNAASCRKGLGNRGEDEPKKGAYTELLRQHADSYPGRHTSFSYNISDGDDDHAILRFDWDAHHMSDFCVKRSNEKATNTTAATTDDKEERSMLMFALPHHMDQLPEDMLPEGKRRYCKSTITGPACLVRGNSWTFRQELPHIRFRAPRPPRPEFIPSLAKVLKEDMKWTLPYWVIQGAGDTYFSGKYLAKLARILLIAEEVNQLCGKHGGRDFISVCSNSTLPSESQMQQSIEELREGVQVWISGKAETPFVYDKTWGGIISCGCTNEKCNNKYPDCPGLSDPNSNFGNGFYNDHHFHYGYHIYAAAAVAHFDPKWGQLYFERVIMLVRDIANPSKEDSAFPLFRQKDWYQGSSWASGITTPAALNGRNQESSSEAIAAYEGVALYGQMMRDIWKDEGEHHKAKVANEIAKTGKLLAGTELTSAKRYWHVNKPGDPNRIYPRLYESFSIGILWNTMAQFGTWFGAAPYLPIGIQLLPLTPISEDRDDIEWANLIYKPLTKYCAADFKCTESGWAILQLAILATVGYSDEAAMRMKELPDNSFENAGGNGQSRTNTLWYISTRPEVLKPVPMLRFDKRGREEVLPKPLYQLKDCYLPQTCTDSVLDRLASEFTCRERISYLIEDKDMAEWEACWRIGGLEFPDICGECNPGVHFVSKEEEKQGKKEEEKFDNIATGSLQCEPCTHEQCNSDLNRCPVYKRTFVCTEGTSKFGCSGNPEFWVEEEQCDSCCEMTHCLDLKDKEAKKLTNDGNALEESSCPPCKPSICYGKLNQCPIHTAPYLCTKGVSWGGCSSSPWHLHEDVCSECCEIKVEC